MASGRNVVSEERPASGLTVSMSAVVPGAPGNTYRSQRLMRPSARSAALSKWCDTNQSPSQADRHLAEVARCEPYLAGADCRSAVAPVSLGSGGTRVPTAG